MILRPFLSFLSLNIGEPLCLRHGRHHSLIQSFTISLGLRHLHACTWVLLLFHQKFGFFINKPLNRKKKFGNIGEADGWVDCHSLRLGSLGLVCVMLGSMLFLLESLLGVRAWWRGGNAQMV